MTASPQVLKIQPVSGWASTRISELWRSRELIYFLTWRDIKVRYKQTLLGAAWAILQPVLTMVVFSVFLGRLAGVPSDGVPYPVFAFAALTPWTFFANSLGASANSLVGSANLIKRVYFPRMALPLASVLGGLLDFVLALSVLFLLMAFYGLSLSVQALWLPLFLAVAVLSSLSAGLWLAALNVRYRDVRYAIPFLLQTWMFLSPVAYPSSLIQEPWRDIYALNPMAAVIDGFRWALIGSGPDPFLPLLISLPVVTLLTLSGVLYFRRVESAFADLI